MTTSFFSSHWRLCAGFALFAGLMAVACAAPAQSPISAEQSQPKHTKALRHGPTRYRLVDLDLLPGADSSEAYSLDNQGHVVGSVSRLRGWITIPIRPFLYRQGRMHSLGLLPDQTEGAACGISSRGLVVGGTRRLTLAEYRQRAFLWRDGSLIDLGTLVGCRGSQAAGINSHAQIVGWASTSNSRDRAFLWQNGRMRGLGTLPGFSSSRAMAVNKDGQIVGYAEGSQRSDAAAQAFLYSRGKMRSLGRLGGDYSRASGLNDGGRVVGETAIGRHDEHGNPITHPFLWERRRGMRDLGSLGGTYGEARGINRQGLIVGAATGADARDHAFLWEHGRLHDLNDLIAPGSRWFLAEANAINDRGQIVGTGVLNGHERAFLLTPLNTNAGRSTHTVKAKGNQ